MTEDTEAPTRGPATDDPHPQRWRILAVSLVIGFMALLDVTIVNVAIPSIQSGLGTTAGTVQWVVSGYALAFGLTLVTGGRLGDAYGRRRLMLIGLAGFIVASAAVGLAPTVGWVIAARLAQGAAAGFLTPQNSGLIQQLFSGAERGRAFGLFGLTVSVASGLGPVIGGVILAVFGEEQGWRYIFLVNVPIGLVAMVAVTRMVPRRAPRPAGEPRPGLDLVGAGLLGGAVLCLLLPWSGSRAVGGCRSCSSSESRRCCGPSSGGSTGSAAAAGHRCWTSRCCVVLRASPTASPSAASTSPASPGSSWCCRCPSRSSSATHR